jgi:two-component system, NtrC family, nitrogen regulation response regulator NtrX
MAHDILIVDDEADIRMLIAGVLKDEGYATREAADSAQAVAVIHARQPTLVILDIWLQGSALDGIEILRLLRAEMPSVPVVMISGHGTIETAVEAIKIGAYDFIEKPFKSDRLLLVVERAIEAAQLRRENEELKLRAGGDLDLVGASPLANQLRQQIDKAAPTGSRVLVTGPPGAGKEVVGRLLHLRSRRAKGPFVPVNCATMRPERLEIELFGTESGNDGAPRKVGTFERAHGGTLFLDEVADMPLETQGKIVRVLQEQTFERIGGASRVEVDVRVVASSNRELAGEISAGRFREDLFYRLNVVSIALPPLRERLADIIPLAEHFLRLAAGTAGPPRRMTAALAAQLLRHDWPGNIRELKNVIDRASILVRGDVIDVGDLEFAGSPAEKEAAGDANLWLSEDLPTAVAKLEAEMIRRALVACGGNRTEAARRLNINRQLLYTKAQRYGLNEPLSEITTNPVRKPDVP